LLLLVLILLLLPPNRGKSSVDSHVLSHCYCMDT